MHCVQRLLNQVPINNITAEFARFWGAELPHFSMLTPQNGPPIPGAGVRSESGKTL
jgi:hypothetical protein